MAGDQRLSQRAFAERSGLSTTTIRKRVNDGTLKLDAEGKIPLSAGLQALARRTRLAEAEDEEPLDPDGLEGQLLAARVRERKAISKLRELELEHEEGRFVQLADVQADARAAAETIRSSLLALPARVALQVEAIAAGSAPRAPQIEALIADEVNAMLVALQGSRYSEEKQ